LELQENDIGNESMATTPSATTATLNNKTPRCFSSSYLTSHGVGCGDYDDDTESEWDRVGLRYSSQQKRRYKGRNSMGSDYSDDDDDDDDSMSCYQRPMMFPRDIPSEELGIVFENSTTEGDENANDTSTAARENEGDKYEANAASSPVNNNELPSSHLSAETSSRIVIAGTTSQSSCSRVSTATANDVLSQRSTPTHTNGVGLFSSSMSTTARSNGGSGNAYTNGGNIAMNDEKLESSIKFCDKKSPKNEATACSVSASSPSLPAVKHTLYIQMQLCSGHTISDYLSNPDARRGSMNKGGEDIPAALRLFLQVAQAVHHVHEQGLIHRDLKPSNCFMLDSGVVKVGDFGLSRGSNDKNESLLNSTATSTLDAAATTNSGDEDDDHTAGIGTRLYASPEQTKGSNYDSSTDV
jgi:Protein kinase domain